MSKKAFIVFSSVIAVALFCFVIVSTDSLRPESYSILFILPLSFGVCSFLLFQHYNTLLSTTPALILYLLYFIRNVVCVLVMSLGNYAGYYTVANATDATILIVYEQLLVFLCVNRALRKYKVIPKQSDELLEIDRWTYQKTPIKFLMAMIMVVIFMISVYIIIPGVRRLFVSIWSFDGSLVTESVSSIANGANRSIITLFSFLFDFMRILLPVYLFRVIRKYTKGRTLGLVLSLPFILLQLAFITATSALAIFCAFVDLYVLIKLYPLERKSVITISYAAGIIAVVAIFLLKFNSTVLYKGSQLEALSQMLQAYFSGVSNITACENIPGAMKGSALFFDVYYTIPFNGTLFGLSGQTSANLFNSFNSGKFQIIPCIGQAAYYLGPVLAPVIPCMMATYAIKAYYKNAQEKNIWLYTARTLLWLYLCISPIMYNAQIFLSRFNNTILPCLFITYLASRGGLKIKTKFNA